MVSESSDPSLSARPELDEFLSALGGFLHQKPSLSDPQYLNFLSTFCRSIGAKEGHFCTRDEASRLHSAVSFGFDPQFDNEFNRLSQKEARPVSPLHKSYAQGEVVAIMDLSKKVDSSPWFNQLMKKYEIQSLVSVPLMGKTGPLGILCAYYHDVCLFDQATLDHLSMIGRMVGSTLEKEPSLPKPLTSRDKAADDFLLVLTKQSFAKVQAYQWCAKLTQQATPAAGVMVGPVRRSPEGWGMTPMAGEGMPSSKLSKRITLPIFLDDQIRSKKSANPLHLLDRNKWGELKPLLKGSSFQGVAAPLLWRNEVDGAILAWAAEEEPFQKEDVRLIHRMASILSLSLHT